MKRTLLSLMAISLFFAACNKDDDPTAEKWYLTRLIDVYETGSDTTFISYNADNTLKESRFSFEHNDAPAFNAFGPLYEGGKISGLQMWTNSMPTPHKISSYVYTGNLVTSAEQEVYDQNAAAWVINSRDSLVYTGGKLAELYSRYRNGSTTFYKLTWEGENVKSCSVYSKAEGDTEFALYQTISYTYDTKPAFHTLLNDNYYWLADVSEFTYLSANSVLKVEMFRQPEGTLEMSRTNTYTYDQEGKLTAVDTRIASIYPVGAENLRTELEYTKR